MALIDSDISWDMLRLIVRDWAGTTAQLVRVEPLHGGYVNATLALGLQDGQRAVLKISPHRVNRAFVEEAYQLNFLRSLEMPAPQVYACKVGTLEEPFSYLLMEFMEGVDLATARRRCHAEQFDHLQTHLAELVAALHAHTARRYGRVAQDQREEFASWPEFYRGVYDAILREAARSPLLGIKQRKQIARVHDKLDRLIVHADCPRLVHWDIWASNVLAQSDRHGRWRVTALLDPNCKYAHAEAEIAYLELFRTVTPAFVRAYQGTHRLGADYQRVRKPVYQLYGLLNHLHVFGQEYVQPVAVALDAVWALA